ncbi:ion transporter [bacterium]|nr:ion transporter [bacterium]
MGATMLTLFVVSTFDEWPEFSDKVRRADLDASGVAWIYFALVVALAGLLVANLFIAVITIAYGRAADIEEAVSDYEKIDPMAAVDDDEAAPETPVTWCPFIAGVSPQLRTLVTHGFFEGFIMVIVVLNTISMASEHYGQSEDFTHTLHITEIIFVTIYCIEITLKWFGLGFKEYFSSGFNCLDFGVVVISLLGFMLSAVDGFQVFRIVRMLRLTRVTRLLRLLKRYDSVMNLLRTVMGSWTAIANVSFFIIVMHVVFGVMGIHMIGNNPSQGWEPPRENFHDFWRAVMSVFQVFTGEDWSVLMFGYMRSHGSWCCLYFLLVFSVMNFVCDSLFVAVILENFETAEAEKMGKQKKLYEKALALKAEQEAKPDEVALLLEAPEEPLPEKPRPTDCSDAKALVERKSFENFIIVIILMSSVCLAIEGPANATYLKGKDGLVTTLHVLDVLFFLIFWVECLLKIAAYGFLGYIQDGWSRLDFFVVVMTTVDVVAQAVSSDSAAGWARIFRVFRVLRPLRVASKFENIRVIVDALVSSIGAVSATLFLAAFFFVVFAILGTNMFMGRFQICTADESLNKADCVALAGNGTSTWSNREMHFDDIFSSLQTLFMVSTSEGWVTIMNWAVDSADKDSGAAPVYNGYQWYAVFFILFIFFAKFFITNLFVGVLVQHFQESSGSSLLTEAQTKWSRFEMLCLMTKMQGDNREELKEVEKSSVKKTFYPIVKSNIFETVVLVTIIGNVVLLLAEHWPGSGDWESFLDIMNFIFLVVFTVEIFMQILAIGLGGYFKNDWNKLDFFIVFFSWLFTFIGVAVGVQAGRGVRMLRVLLVLKSAMTVRGIVMTLILSIAPAINVAAALFLVIFVYGIAGMHFYGDYANCDDNRLNDLNNFSNIFNAMMILFQVMLLVEVSLR